MDLLILIISILGIAFLLDNQLFRIFLLIAILINANMKMKILIIFVLIAIRIFNSVEYFKSTNNTNIKDIIKNINEKTIIYGNEYDKIKVDNLTFKIYNLAESSPELGQLINEKSILVYGLLRNNLKLRNYLLHKNLIGADNMPLFKVERDDLLFRNDSIMGMKMNVIKILIVLMPEDEINSLYNQLL